MARHAQDIVTLAPAPSGAGTEVLVVTEDDFFLLNARKVVTLPNRIWHATSDLQAADMLTSKPCSVVVLDVALVQSRLQEVVSRLRGQFPDLAFVIAGEEQDETEAAPLLSAGDAQSFVSKQQTAKQLAAALSAGIDRHLELQTEAAQQRPAGSGEKRALILAGIAVTVVAAVATGVWLAFSGGRETTPETAMPVDVAPRTQTKAPTVETIERELQRAREAFEAGHYLEPKNDNALKFYRAVLALDPANAEAHDGIERIAGVMLARTEAALLEGNPREAAAALKTAKAVEPTHPRIAFLDAQVTRELERLATARQEAADAEQARQQLAKLVKREKDRIAQERLAEQQRLEAERQKVAAEQARAAAVAAAQPIETPEQLKARRQAELLGKPEVVQASMVAKQVQPQYPDRAQREGVQGYVDLRFIVTTTGEVKDITIVGAQPEGYFENAATRAVKKWKFKPRQIDGELYEQSMSLRLRFQLDK